MTESRDNNTFWLLYTRTDQVTLVLLLSADFIRLYYANIFVFWVSIIKQFVSGQSQKHTYSPGYSLSWKGQNICTSKPQRKVQDRFGMEKTSYSYSLRSCRVEIFCQSFHTISLVIMCQDRQLPTIQRNNLKYLNISFANVVWARRHIKKVCFFDD